MLAGLPVMYLKSDNYHDLGMIFLVFNIQEHQKDSFWKGKKVKFLQLHIMLC